MEKRFRVTLTEEERQGLQKLVSVGRGAARKLVRARILLLADQGEGGPAKPDPEIVEALGCGRATVERVRSSRCRPNVGSNAAGRTSARRPR